MFSNAIQDAGVKVFAKHHIEEGIELTTNYAKHQKSMAVKKA